MPETISKQPSESWLYDMDFTPRLGASETLNGLVSVTQEEVDLETDARTATTDLNISSQAFTAKAAQCRISAGINGKNYVVTFRATTLDGNSVEAEGILQVTDT